MTKRILIIISAFAIIIGTSTNISTILVQAAQLRDSKVALLHNNIFIANDIKCMVRTLDLYKDVEEAKKEPDYIVDKVKLTVEGGIAKIETEITGEKVEFNPKLYRSQIVADSTNAIFGIDTNLSSGFRLTRFIIENEVEMPKLMNLHKDISKVNTIRLAFYNTINNKNYYLQFDTDQLDTSNIQAEEADIAIYELANFAAIPYEKVDADFHSLSMEYESESSASAETSIEFQNLKKDNHFNKNFEVLEESEDSKIINLLREQTKNTTKDFSYKSTSLPPNIPDYLYKSGTYGWEHKEFGYKKEGENASRNIGYYIYHMPVADSKNVLNYVMRYETVANYNFISQQFIHSFKITHNLWIKYLSHSNEVYIFDDRPSNARIVVETDNFVKTNDNKAYFTHFQTSSITQGSLLMKIVRAVIGFVPKLGKATVLYEEISSGTKIETGSWHPTDRYAKEIRVKINNLIHPNDHSTVLGLGTSVKHISYGYRCHVSTK